MTRSSTQRDSLLTIVGLSGLVGAFVLLVSWPGHKAAAKLRQEIEQAEQAIRDIPQRVLELEGLKKQIQEREDYVRRMRKLIPRHSDAHGVINQVAALAEDSQLIATRLEPLPGQSFETYRIVPFRITFQGDFQRIVTFLRGLEGCERLITVESVSLRSGSGGNVDFVATEVGFAVYAQFVESEGGAEKTINSESAAADISNDVHQFPPPRGS